MRQNVPVSRDHLTGGQDSGFPRVMPRLWWMYADLSHWSHYRAASFNCSGNPVRQLKLPCAVVVNRAGEDQVGLYQYCRTEKLPVLLSLPDDRQIAEVTSRGDLVARALPEYGLMFAELAERLKQELLTAGCRL